MKMRQVSNTALLACFVFAILLNGCAYNAFIPNRSFERIEISVTDSNTSIDSIPSRSESTANGAIAGGFGGLTASFFGSLMCGPYFAICFAASAPATIGATTLVGGVIGMSGISGEDAEKIIPYLQAMQATHNNNQELATALIKQLPASSLAPPGVADARISMDVNSLRLQKGFGQRVVFSLSAVTRFEWDLNKPKPQQYTRTFRCSTKLRRIDEWTEDDGVTIESELNYCIEDLARQINKMLIKSRHTSVDGFPEFDV